MVPVHTVKFPASSRISKIDIDETYYQISNFSIWHVYILLRKHTKKSKIISLCPRTNHMTKSHSA